MRVCDDGMKDAEYTGYYERVKDGEGTFVQKIVKGEDGNESLSFVRQDHGNIIWHTVNDFENRIIKIRHLMKGRIVNLPMRATGFIQKEKVPVINQRIISM